MTKQTICWTCKNAVGGCSWSRSFEPVKGWEAQPTKLKYVPEKHTDSYIVIKCPEYIHDREYGGKTENYQGAKYGRSEVEELSELILKAKKHKSYFVLERITGISRHTLRAIAKKENKGVRVAAYNKIKEKLKDISERTAENEKQSCKDNA